MTLDINHLPKWRIVHRREDARNGETWPFNVERKEDGREWEIVAIARSYASAERMLRHIAEEELAKMRELN